MTNLRKDNATRSYVTCAKCAYEIQMLTTKGLPREFSLRCPKCEARKMYDTAQIHDETEIANVFLSEEELPFKTKNRHYQDTD